jgi:hypothetical protein
MSKKQFFTDKPGYHHATINNRFYSSANWEAYARGYLVAADSLVTKVLQEDSNHDILIYPIVFLYRHYFELRLKEIIDRGSALLDEETKMPTHHDLMTIWAIVKRMVFQVWPDSKRSSVSEIEFVLTGIVNVDKKSDSFRYPVTTEGAATLETVEKIDIIDFESKLKPAIEHLESISFGISVFLEGKQEMRQYCRDFLEPGDLR